MLRPRNAQSTPSDGGLARPNGRVVGRCELAISHTIRVLTFGGIQSTSAWIFLCLFSNVAIRPSVCPSAQCMSHVPIARKRRILGLYGNYGTLIGSPVLSGRNCNKAIAGAASDHSLDGSTVDMSRRTASAGHIVSRRDNLFAGQTCGGSQEHDTSYSVFT